MSDNVTRKEFHHALSDINEFYVKKTEMPKKLSDLENDLFYKKQVEKLRLTASDFTWSDDFQAYMYQCSPKVNWMTSADDIDFTAVYTINGETITLTKDDSELMADEHYPEIGDIIIYMMTQDNPIGFFNGIDAMTEEPNDELTILSVNIPDSLIIHGFETKKIPIEYCDTSEIEAEIDKLTSEVESL